MTEIAEKLKLELSQLSIQERAELAHFLIHSLDGEIDENIEARWDVELERRMQEIHNNTASGKPAHQVFTELRKKYL